MARWGAAVLIVVLAVGFVAALPHWRGHNHHGWRSQHGLERNSQSLLVADSFKDLFPQHHHHGLHTREHRHQHWPHYSPRWGHHQETDDQKTSQSPHLGWPHRSWSHHFPPSGHAQPRDDQKSPQSLQLLPGWQPHSRHHHSHSWSLDRTKDQRQETVPSPQPHLGLPHRSWSHRFSPPDHAQSIDDQKTSQIPQPILGWQPHSWQHHSHSWNLDKTKVQGLEILPIIQPLLEWPHRRHDHSLHGRRHHWPHWTRSNHNQITVNKESQQIYPQINNEDAAKVDQIIENNNNDNTEVQKALGEVEKLNQSPQNTEKQKTQEIQQTVKYIEDETAKVDQISNEEQTLQNNEEQETNKSKNSGLSEDGTTIKDDRDTKESHQYIKMKEDAASRNSDNIKNPDTENNLAMHFLTKCQAINADGIKIKLNNVFCFWPEGTAETDKSVDGTTIVCEEKAIIPDVLMPDDKYFRSGQFEKRIECRELASVQEKKDNDVSKQTDAIQNKYKHKDNGFANTNDKNSENVKVQQDKTEATISNSTEEMPPAIVNNYEAEEKQSDKDDKHHVVLVQRAGETGFYIPQTTYKISKDKVIQEGSNSDNVVESNLDSLKHNGVKDEKNKDIDVLMKELLDLFVESFSDSPGHVETSRTSTSNTITKGVTEEIIETFSDITTDDIQEGNTNTSAKNDKFNKDSVEHIESISNSPKLKDVQELLETISHNYEIIEEEIDELDQTISDNPAHTDEEIETTTNNNDIKKDNVEPVEFISDSPKLEDVQEETTETTAKEDDIEKNTDEPIVIFSQGDDFYIRDLLDVIEAS